MCPDLEYQRMNAADLGNNSGSTELGMAVCGRWPPSVPEGRAAGMGFR
jgi:hypothetical protein